VREGLARVLADTPVRGGYLEAQAGITTWSGPYARAEAGYRPAAKVGLFGFGEWRPGGPGGGAAAGFGARVTW
jgi:hypothetical protein